MKAKNKKTAAGAVLMYLLLTGGLWMFINSYANSFNRLSCERITPASLTIGCDSASVRVLDGSLNIDLEGCDPDSKLCCAAYIGTPDELRAVSYVISFAYRE